MPFNKTEYAGNHYVVFHTARVDLKGVQAA